MPVEQLLVALQALEMWTLQLRDEREQEVDHGHGTAFSRCMVRLRHEAKENRQMILGGCRIHALLRPK